MIKFILLLGLFLIISLLMTAIMDADPLESWLKFALFLPLATAWLFIVFKLVKQEDGLDEGTHLQYKAGGQRSSGQGVDEHAGVQGRPRKTNRAPP